jgi:hypothetical protein
MPARAKTSTRTKSEDVQLVTAFRKLTPARRTALLEYAQFLATRAAPVRVPASAHKPIPRPKHESVVQAIRRLTRNYPMLDRNSIMGEISRCLAVHMVDGREAAAVIDELEALFARVAQPRP